MKRLRQSTGKEKVKKAQEGAHHLEGLSMLRENTTFHDDGSLVEICMCFLYCQGALSDYRQ